MILKNKKILLITLFIFCTGQNTLQATPSWINNAYSTIAHWCSSLAHTAHEYKKSTRVLLGLAFCSVLLRVAANTLKKQCAEQVTHQEQAKQNLKSMEEKSAELAKSRTEQATKTQQLEQSIAHNTTHTTVLKTAQENAALLPQEYQRYQNLQQKNTELQTTLSNKVTEITQLNQRTAVDNFLPNYEYWRSQALNNTDEKRN